MFDIMTYKGLLKYQISFPLFKVSELSKFQMSGFFIGIGMDYLRMDGKQYASKVRNKALEDFDWLSQWLE